MKRILVDMDGVLADVYSRFYEIHEKETGIKLYAADVAGKLEADAFPGQRKWVSAQGFFRTVPIMKGSVEGLRMLNEKYDVIVISMATEFPQSLTDKQIWLHEHYPFIKWEQVVFCGNKNIISADIMIDDHPKNLDNFRGETFIFTQPHNINENNPKHRRVDSWDEIKKLLIPG